MRIKKKSTGKISVLAIVTVLMVHMVMAIWVYDIRRCFQSLYFKIADL